MYDMCCSLVGLTRCVLSRGNILCHMRHVLSISWIFVIHGMCCPIVGSCVIHGMCCPVVRSCVIHDMCCPVLGSLLDTYMCCLVVRFCVHVGLVDVLQLTPSSLGN